MCKVTIITTCYNAGAGLKKTIESVLSQTFTDFEYIIQDGNSSDDSVALAKSYEEAFKLKGINYLVYSEADTGIYDGMNKGVEKANGEYINFMNADDIFYSADTLSAIFDSQSFKSKDIIFGDCVEEEYGGYYYFPKDFSQIKNKMPFSHQSVFAKKEHLITFPFNTSLKIGADYDFLLTCYDNELSFADCGQIVCLITKDGVSSINLYNTFVETIDIQKAHGIVRFSEKEYQHKLKILKIKQFGMNYFPVFIKKFIRHIQRIMRRQNKKVNQI